MAYFPAPQSDTTATTVQSSTAWSTGGTPTVALDTAGYRSVDFIIEFTTMASVTEAEVMFMGTAEATPGPGDWFPVSSEEPVEGGDPGQFYVNPYAIKLENLDPSMNGKIMCLSIPVRGIKMSAFFTATAGTVTGSAYEVKALRRA